MIVSWFRRRKSRKAAAAGLYQSIVSQSRDAQFYDGLGVDDTLDGRFDLVSLHTSLLIGRLETEKGREPRLLAQALFDHMFRSMDDTLREIGVGDLAVPKHMHRMMQAFNGRVQNYQSAIESGDHERLELALTRNLYRTRENLDPHMVRAMAGYVMNVAQSLSAQDANRFFEGIVFFPQVLPESKRAARA